MFKSLFISFKNIFILQTNIIMTGKLFRPRAIHTLESESKNDSDSDSSESWIRNCFWSMSMVESQSEWFGIELES